MTTALPSQGCVTTFGLRQQNLFSSHQLVISGVNILCWPDSMLPWMFKNIFKKKKRKKILFVYLKWVLLTHGDRGETDQ